MEKVMPAGYAVARARPLLPRAEVRAPSAVRPPSRGHCSRGREHRGNCRHAKGRTRAPDVAGADERASRSRILALWEDRSAPHPAAATRKPRNRAEASGRVQRGGANDPPRAPFLRPAPRGPAGAFPTDPSGGARGCRDARPTGSPSRAGTPRPEPPPRPTHQPPPAPPHPDEHPDQTESQTQNTPPTQWCIHHQNPPPAFCAPHTTALNDPAHHTRQTHPNTPVQPPGREGPIRTGRHHRRRRLHPVGPRLLHPFTLHCTRKRGVAEGQGA